MNFLNELSKDPANYLFGLAITVIAGVWWARMTPAQSNFTLFIGVVLIGVAAAIKTGGLPLLIRALWVGLGVCVSGLFVYYQLWTPRAETLDAKMTVLAAVENREYRELVAEVVHAFEPHAYISVAGSVLGPDGARTVDILVWPISGSVRTPIAIDVIDRSDGKPVGIEAIDAADSKRRDVRANAMLLCSNTGFDTLAIQKAKRANIGLISVLKQGDQRIKGKILEEIYLRNVDMRPVVMQYEGATPVDSETVKKYLTATHDVTYAGGSVGSWLQHRAWLAIFANPKVEGPILARFELKRPTEFLVKGHQVTLRSLSISFHPRVQWLSQIVTIDAKNGIYDYVRGRVRLTGGPNSYVIAGINFDTAKPMASAPEVSGIGVGLHPGEAVFSLMMLEPFDMPQGIQIPKLDELVRPEDLSLTIIGTPSAQAGGQVGGIK